jgi:hypothetical protein
VISERQTAWWAFHPNDSDQWLVVSNSHDKTTTTTNELPRQGNGKRPTTKAKRAKTKAKDLRLEIEKNRFSTAFLAQISPQTMLFTLIHISTLPQRVLF